MISGFLIILFAIVISVFGANDQKALIMCFDRDEFVEQDSAVERDNFEDGDNDASCDNSKTDIASEPAPQKVATANTTKITVGGRDIKKAAPATKSTPTASDSQPTSLAALANLASDKDPNKKAKEMAQRRYDKYMGDL